MSYTNNHHIEANAVQRLASLPLFDSALKSVVSVYTDVKGRYPLLGVVGGVAEIGVRNVSQAAILRATPLLLSLEPQIEVVNNYACMGLDQLEKNFPVLHQSTEEVLGSLKDAFFLALDDVQLRVNDELDGMQGRWDKLTDATWYYLLALQESQLGQMATLGLDDILTRSEEAMAKYMPLTATLRLEWERRTQQYEDEDGEDEPGLRTRFRGLLLCLSLQLYHRLLKLRNRLERAMGMLQDATDRMGLSRLLEVVGSMLQMLQLFYVSQVLRLEAMRRLALDQLKAQVRVLAELGPINQLLGLPAQVQLVVADLQELGKILLQLLVNNTPLYNMLQQPSDQDVEGFLNQQESMSSDTTCRSSDSSLFLKAMDGRPHKRKSSYARSQTGSTSAPSPASAKSPNGSRGSQKQDDQTLSLELKNQDLPSTIAACRRSSVRRGSSSGINPPDPSPVPGPAPANPANDDDQSLSRQGSQKPDDQPLSRQGSQKPDDQPLSRRGSQKQEDQPLFVELDSTVCRRSSAIEFLLAPIIQYLSPEQLSDETVIPEVETTKFHADTRDESLPRHQSLSARSQRSSSSAGNPDDQSLSRRGSQKQADQPFSLELDPLELPSTSTMRRPSSAAEVLLGSILQYLSSEPPSDETIIPEVETTENHTETRDKSPPRHKSLSAHSRKSSSSAGNSDDQPLSRRGSQTPDNQPLSCRGNQKPDDQPLSLELDPLELPSTSIVCHPSSAAEVLLGSVLQYINSEPSSDEPVEPEVETTENHIKARDESLPRRKSLSSSSHWSLSSAVAPVVETTEDLSPEQGSDEAITLEVEGIEYNSDTRDMSQPKCKSLSARSRQSSSSAVAPEVETSEGLRPEEVSDEVVALEVESTEYYSDAREESPSRCKSLSARSRRSSSSAGNPDDQPLSNWGSQKPDNQPLSRRGSQKPDDQPLSRLGSQKPDDQPLSLELDPLQHPSTSTILRPFSASKVLLGSVLQYLSSEPPSEETIKPKVETTKNHTEARDESSPRRKSLSALELDPLELPSTSTVHRPSSAAEVLLGSILQYLSSEPRSDETIKPEEETTENYTKARDESPPRPKSLSARSRWRSYSAAAPEVETTEDQSPEKVSDQAVALEGESTESYSDARDMSPPRCKSLSARSRRSSSSVVAPEVETIEGLRPEQVSDEVIYFEVESTEYYSDARDESPSRRKSLSAHSRRSSSNAGNPDDQPLSNRGSQKPDDQPLPRWGSQKPDNQPLSLELDPLQVPSTTTVLHLSSASEVLLGPILQYLSSEPPSDETIITKVETTESQTEARDESPPRPKSLSARSRWSSYSAVAPEVETTEDQSPEKVSDEAVALEGESTEYYSDARDVSPSRRNSLSAGAHRSSSSAGNPDVQPLSRRGSQKPDDQPLSRQGSQKPDDQPLSLELDPLELPSTSTVRRPSSAAEVLQGSILQYISSEPPLEDPVVPEVDNTENTEVRDESPPRCKSLSVQSRRSSSSAGNPSNVHQGSQMTNDQPLSVEFDILEVSSTSALHRRSFAAEVLLGPILQYLSSEPSSDEIVIPEVETTEKNAQLSDESPPRRQSLSPRSRRSSSSAVVPEVETPEYYSDEGDSSPLRHKSLSIRSRRSSSSGGNAPAPRLTPDNPHNVLQGSQMQDNLEELDTNAVHRRSWAVEVLLDPILQYLNPGHSEKADIEEAEIPAVEATEH
eukprot:XP_014016377.1 PREDICTED: mediator of DNA damage checkpoint protein 1-like isoform X2 [Salmo salar]